VSIIGGYRQVEARQWRYTSGCAVWHSQHEKVTRMETAPPFPPLVIAVVDDNPADVYIIARVLHAHDLQYTLQVLESRQRALHFFDQLAGEDIQCPDLLLLDYTLPGLDTRELLQWMKALPVCRRLRMIVMTSSDDPAVETEAMALGADAFFQKPLGFQRFLALGDLIKVVVFGHTHT
jgi:two-component system, chemotaxis family, response regulator Rcp1